MSDSLLSVSSAFGGAYQDLFECDGGVPGFTDVQLQAGQGVGYQR